MIDKQPSRFGKYLLLERIGIGGMAEVFKAKTFGAEGFERLVAIKRILPHLVEDDDFVKMFIDEAKIAVRLSHPNIVAVQDLGKAEGTLYIAMEYVLGRDLRAIYDYENEHEGHPPVGLACHMVMKICEALHHAHFATGPRGEPLQVIHRDVSPQNVLVSFDGEVKVADFGLAKARGRMVQTQAGVVKGKLAYMSPEQLRGDEIDHRVDVFGLGIVLYELLTGERLFLGPSDMDTLRRVYEAKVPPMRDLNPDIDEELENIARKALAKDRDQRYQTALDLHDDLQAYVYSSGRYQGASALRQYMREAFPDAAPPAADLPPFAASIPPAPPRMEPRPTHRPPALGGSTPRVEIAPPPIEAAAPAYSSAPPQPPVPAYEPPAYEPPAPEPSAPVFADPTVNEPAAEEPVEERDEAPTDRPPPMDDALAEALGQLDDAPDLTPAELPAPYAQAGQPGVVAQRIVETGRPPPPEHSGTRGVGPQLPSAPPGVYADEHPTAQVDSLEASSARGPDTRPAPANEELPDFVSEGWDDDEPTMMLDGGLAAVAPPLVPKEASGLADVEDETDLEDPWAGDENTVIVDPRNTGSG